MIFHEKEIYKQVVEGRKKGKSVRELGIEFNIPNTVVSRWVRDVPSSSPNSIRAKNKRNDYLSEWSHLPLALKKDKETAKVLVSLLYWCEGSKYPSTNGVTFTNSDVSLITTFLGLFRYSYKINEEKFRVHLQLHSTHDVAKIYKYWSKLLGIPLSQFYKPTITSPRGKRKRQGYMGTCTIKYNDVKLLLNFTGIFQKFAQIWGEVA